MDYVDRQYAREMQATMERRLRELERQRDDEGPSEELDEAIADIKQQLKDAPWL